ncbi:hypothetical protein LguiA_031757 [Lonicera macranthoides]
MVVRINKSTSVLVYFLLFICLLLSSGVVEGFSCGSNNFYSLHKKDDGVRIKSRKVLVHEEVVLDYDYPGANPRHDPKKGKPPKNP